MFEIIEFRDEIFRAAWIRNFFPDYVVKVC